jgi:hypothetical protein
VFPVFHYNHRLLCGSIVHPESGGFSFQRGTSIWNNSSPDTAALINPSGETVSTNDYPPGC